MPCGAPALAEAVKALSSLLVAVAIWKAPGVSSAVREPWKVASALLSVPKAEICAETCWVWLEIRVSCGASVAATSWETSELTSITEPPAAPALLLLATETTGEDALLSLLAELLSMVVLTVSASGP